MLLKEFNKTNNKEIHMNNNQKTLNDRTLLGLRKRIPSPKPKKERILETVNRIVSRIQNDQRNYK